MATSVLAACNVHRGHFVLESGYHTDQWIDLETLFIDHAAIAPAILALASRLRAHDLTAVCGPLFGGAFLAQSLAAALDLRFHFTAPQPSTAHGLYSARYALPTGHRPRIAGARVAVVDDVIGAGSSVRATVDAVRAEGAAVVAIGCFAVLGERGSAHFRAEGLPFEALEQHALTTWKPDDCPLCAAGTAVSVPDALPS